MINKTGRNHYEVGYGKPPKATQFKPGQSGNRKGRPKGARSVMTCFEELAVKKFITQENGQQKKLIPVEISLLKLLSKVAKEDVRAIGLFLEYAERFDQIKAVQHQAIEALNSDDKAILDDFFKEGSQYARKKSV